LALGLKLPKNSKKALALSKNREKRVPHGKGGRKGLYNGVVDSSPLKAVA